MPRRLSALALLLGCGDAGGSTDSAAATTAPTTVTTASPTTTSGATSDATANATTSAAPTTSTSQSASTSTTSTSTTTPDTSTTTGSVDATGVDSTGADKLDLPVQPDFGADMCMNDCKSDAAGQASGDWLLHIAAKVLVRIDVSDGSTTALCVFKTAPSGTKSLTFTRTNRLFSTDGMSLFEIDPCLCEYEKVGSFGPGMGSVYGIAPDEANGLFGISEDADALMRINPMNAQATIVGPLGVPVATHGAAWSEADQKLYMITAGKLYTVDTQTGAATEIGPLGDPFTTVGVEEHPATGVLYGCTGGGLFYRIDKATAATELIGPLQDIPACTNLGAPWTGSDVCLPAPG